MSKRLPDNQQMVSALDSYRSPETTGWEHGWVGLEPTFQSKKSIKKWHAMSQTKEGEDAYFVDTYMLRTQHEVARGVANRYAERRKNRKKCAPFARVRIECELDQWKVRRQNIHFYWNADKLENFDARFGLDPETFEWSIKPVPVGWLYEEPFLRFLEEFVFGVPAAHGLTPSIAHGGGQFSIAAKCLMDGSVLADDIAYRVNHPELSTFIMDWPNPDDRPFRATRKRFTAFRTALAHYWAGGFHPRAVGPLTVENALLERGFGPNPAPPPGLMDPRRGPIGDARTIFQTNFAFSRGIHAEAQVVHAGYWQSAHPDEEGYRPDQIGRYSEVNLNRIQIAGELHVKSGTVLSPERIPELDAPLDCSALYGEASWEDRGQMGRTSARDMIEAVLLDIHFFQHLARHPHVKIKDSILQDQLLVDGEATVRRHGGDKALAKLRAKARAANTADGGRMLCDFIEPETLFWEAWKVLPDGDKGAIAREAIGGFVERVEVAAAIDPRPESKGADPMEWHRHRIHPVLWKALNSVGLKAKDPVRRELKLWKERKDKYLARRPCFSQAGLEPPWAE
jgi:hypothetical protein